MSKYEVKTKKKKVATWTWSPAGHVGEPTVLDVHVEYPAGNAGDGGRGGRGLETL